MPPPTSTQLWRTWVMTLRSSLTGYFRSSITLCSWVSKATRETVRDVEKGGQEAIVVDSLFFKEEFKNPFEIRYVEFLPDCCSDTEVGTFTKANGKRMKTNFMTLDATFNFLDDR